MPQQARAKRTYEAILLGAQEILELEGLEGLNSNKIARQAGVTPPVFYRYFGDKYDLLHVLGERLTDSQSKLYEELIRVPLPLDVTELEERNYGLLRDTYNLTADFKGGRALMVSLRAIPRLSSVRLDANQAMARLTVSALQKIRFDLSDQEAYERCRLSIEIGYGAIEMLLEVPNLSTQRTMRFASRSIAGLLLR